MDEDKKTERKKRRFAARLKTSRGINCIDSPTQNIVICNAGQATGLTKQIIYNLLSESGIYITPSKFIAEKGHCHSFLVFKSIEDATAVYEKCHGKVAVKDSLLYMSYVENVPDTDVTQGGLPPGLTILADFITPEEEAQLIAFFDWTDDDLASNQLKNRQVKHYGYEFRYGTNDVDLTSPLEERIPSQCDVLFTRLEEKGYHLGRPDQLTVNKYLPGQGIPLHVDTHSPFGDTILSLSLASPVAMEWRGTERCVLVDVPNRAMMVMQGEARYEWQHGIQPRTWDPLLAHQPDGTSRITSDTRHRASRVSLTFRWTRTGPCQCGYTRLCDTAPAHGIDSDVATRLEDLHVHQVYERIAGHFSTTRHKPWPKVVEFMQSVPAGSIVLDLGCGNGKNVLNRDDIMQIACERSEGLLLECWEHIQGVPYADCARLDLLNTGLRDQCADAVICIAVIHHFSTRSRRREAISSIARLLRVGGRALVTVWARDQTNANYLLKDKPTGTNEETISVGGITLPVHENRTQFQHNDLLVPWKLRGKTNDKLTNTTETYLRYYHVFDKGELDTLCNLPNVEIERSFYEEGNWCVIIRKIKS